MSPVTYMCGLLEYCAMKHIKQQARKFIGISRLVYRILQTKLEVFHQHICLFKYYQHLPITSSALSPCLVYSTN